MEREREKIRQIRLYAEKNGNTNRKQKKIKMTEKIK